jgi:hypothetical protein
VTCEHCGTTNAPSADWCSLCLRRFDALVDEPTIRRLPEPAVEIPLAQSALRAPLTKAVMVLLGSIALGLAVSLGLFLIMVMFSVWGSPVHPPTAIVPGAAIIAIGLIVAIFIVATERRPKLRISDEALTLTFPGFRRPFVVPRANVRLITFDDRPVVLLQQNERFPVRGDLPKEVFRDPLDRLGIGVPPVMHGHIVPPGMPPQRDDVAEHEAGWATAGSLPPYTLPSSEPAWLYRPDGSALPVFRTAEHEIPNTAVVFRTPMRSPSAWSPILLQNVWARREIPGMMVRLVGTIRAQMALEGWGVVREVTADDVLDQRLELPKPLRGWRILAFAVFLFLPIIVRVLTR